jgi:hypothetical protein
MAGITTAMATSFKLELLEGKHDFTASTGHVFKMALFKATVTGTYDAGTVNYSTMTGNTDETSGTGYAAGGDTLTNTTPTSSGTTAYTTFAANPSWTSASFSTSGCLIYDSSSSNQCVGVWSFGGTQTVTSGTLTVLMPVNASSTALIQLQ